MLIKHQRLEAFVAGGLRVLTILEAGEANATTALDTLLDGLRAHVGRPRCGALALFFEGIYEKKQNLVREYNRI